MRTERWRTIWTSAALALSLSLGCAASGAPFDAPACATRVSAGKIAVVGEDKLDL